MVSDFFSSGFATDATWRAAILNAGIAGLFNPGEIEDVHVATPVQSHLLRGAFNFFPSAATYTLSLPSGSDIDCFLAAWEHLLTLNPILRTGFIPLSPTSDPLCIVFKSGLGQPVWCTRTEVVGPTVESNPQQFSGKPPHNVTISGSLEAGYHVKISIHYSLLADSGLKPVLTSLHRLYHQHVSGMHNPHVPCVAEFSSATKDVSDDSLPDILRLVQHEGLSETFWRADATHGESQQTRGYETISRHYPCSAPIHLPHFVIQMAIAIVLAIHLPPKPRGLFICEVEAPVARLIRFESDSITPLRELIERGQNQSGPVATQQLIEEISEYGWEAIQVFLNIHTSYSWPQAHEIPGWRLEDLHLAYGNPLNIDILPAEHNATEIRISFDTSVHRMEDANILADHLVCILHSLLAIHQNPILADTLTAHDLIKELGDADASRTLEFGRRQQFPKDSLTPTLVHELFEACVRENPSSTALEFEGQRTLTYAELDLCSSALAVDLHNKYSVEPNVMVPILFEPSFEMIIAILAIMKAGGAYVPFGSDLPMDALRDRMRLIGGKIFICGEDQEARAKEAMAAHPKVVVLPYSWSKSGSLIRTLERRLSSPLPNPTQLAYVLFTSGTTGLPNAVGVEHRNLSAFLSSSLGMEMAGTEKRKLLLSAYTFDISAGDIFSTLTSGGVLALVRREKMLSHLPHWVEVTRTTHLSVTPSIARLLPTTGLPTLSHIIFGGEIVPPDLAERLSQNRTVINSMGPTEATIYATFYIVPKFFGATNFHRRVPIGYPLETTILYVLRPGTMELAAQSEIGEICIGGPQVARGYITNPQLSKTKFVPDIFEGTGHIFRAGDWGRWNYLGQLEILGRMDGQLKYHGIRIETEEIEHVVRSTTDVDQFYSAVLEVDGDQKLVGVFTPPTHTTGVSAAYSYSVLETPEAMDRVTAAIQACEAHFPPNARPSNWFCFDSLPKTAHGKLDGKALNGLIHGHLSRARKVIAIHRVQRPPTEDEDLVRKAISDVLTLPRESIDLDASFIELGGTSMQAMRVTASLQALGLSASVVDILDNEKTITLLAQLPRFELDLESSVARSAGGNQSWQSYSLFSLAPEQWEEEVAAAGFTVEDIEDIYPCTSLAKYWLELALQNDGRALICQFNHHLGRDIDPERFTWCWEQLLINEPTLRTVFLKLPTDKGHENGIWSVVLRSTAPARWKSLEMLTVANGEELQKLLYGTLFAEHRLQLGQVPIRAWLILNTSDETWTFGISRHHALHDARTFDLQHDAFSSLYANGESALPALRGSRSAANSYGAYIASVLKDTRTPQATTFWTDYLQGARPPMWPATEAVPPTFCKDMGTYAFHIGQWQGSIGDVAKRAGVTSGALIRGAYAIATAEGEGVSDALVFEVADGSEGPGFTVPPWGFCSHVKPTRVRVPLGHVEDEGFMQIMRDANRSHVATLPYLGAAWEMTQKVLEVNLATSIVNILDLSRGDFRKDMKTEPGPSAVSSNSSASPTSSGESVRPIFAKTLVSESVVGIYVPVYVEVHILKDKVTYACPYDPSMVQRENMERFVSRQVEVLEMVNRKLA
ncbi:putative nonribosomal peptide synthetase [Mycena leptocephala]|nr:putative nonribosomal peptide synthetase [Mycena leptocephala]